MHTNEGRARRVVMLYAAINALICTAVAMSAVWFGAPLVTGVLGLSVVITMGIVIDVSIREHRPVPVPVRAARRPIRQTIRVRAYDPIDMY